MEAGKQKAQGPQRRKIEDVLVNLNKAATRSFVEDVYSKGNFSAFDRLVADDVRLIDSALPGPLVGKAKYRAQVEEARASMPDLRATITDLVAEGDQVAVRWLMSGTHTGKAMGLEPTGKAVKDVPGTSIFRLADGRIIEERVTWDVGSLFEQVGAGLGNLPVTPDLIEAEKKAMKERVTALADAFNRKDAKAVAALFTEDATLITPGGLFAAGRKDIEKAVQGDIDTVIKDAKSETTLDRMRLLAPKLAAADLTHTLTGPNVPGGKQTLHVAGIGKKVNGQWMWLDGRPHPYLPKP